MGFEVQRADACALEIAKPGSARTQTGFLCQLTVESKLT